jgi:uncharacterized protein YndB with AHSA1/START domain
MADDVDTDRQIVATRVFNAPRDLVFKVWTDPEHVVNWWGPRGFTNTIETMDVRPGGIWRFVMHGPDGVDYGNLITYDEVVPPELIAYTHGSTDPDDPTEFLARVEFAEEGAGTRITMRLIFKTQAERDQVIEDVGAVDGLNSTLDCLDEYLASL